MQLKMHMVTIEDLVPKEHFLRKLESALDLSFVYEETAKLYSHRYGRPPYDPVVMAKYLLVAPLLRTKRWWGGARQHAADGLRRCKEA